MNVLDQILGENFALYWGDSCEVLRGIPDNSIDFGIHSPPFSSLYVYSSSVADLGNSKSHAEFFRHYRYIIRGLYRTTVPGRLCAVHCKDLPLYMGRDDAAGLLDFPGMITRWFQRCGWIFHSRVTIWKDPVVERERTNNSGLLYGNLCQDSTMSRQGMADYLLVFRKWEGLETLKGSKPVNAGVDGAERFDCYVGLEPPDCGDLAQKYRHRVYPDKAGKWPRYNPFPEGSEAYREWSIRVWRKYASPVWFDIDQTNVLNYQLARDEKDVKHICPLQLDVIERAIHLWTNPGDVVLTPFAGVGSELWVALGLGRKAIGIELKDTYYQQATKFLLAKERELANRPMDIFEWAEMQAI